jgi:hypothetical protein
VAKAGDRVVTRITWRGTHEDDFQGVKSTCARVEYVGAANFRLAERFVL